MFRYLIVHMRLCFARIGVGSKRECMFFNSIYSISAHSPPEHASLWSTVVLHSTLACRLVAVSLGLWCIFDVFALYRPL